jgi:hypothetical protein
MPKLTPVELRYKVIIDVFETFTGKEKVVIIPKLTGVKYVSCITFARAVLLDKCAEFTKLGQQLTFTLEEMETWWEEGCKSAINYSDIVYKGSLERVLASLVRSGELGCRDNIYTVLDLTNPF